MARRKKVEYQPGDRRAKLTKEYIDTVVPDSKRFVIWDTEIKGFGLVVAPSGRMSFVLKYRTSDGQQRKPSVGIFGPVTAEGARKNAKDMLSKVWRGEDPSKARKESRANPTVSDLCAEYLKHHAEVHKKVSSRRKDEQNIRNHIKPALGSRKVSGITWNDISSFHRDMKSTPIAANRTLHLLSKMFALAKRWGYYKGDNPARGHEHYPERKVHRHLSELELARLSKALKDNEARHPQVVAIVRLAMFTGCRLSELLSLEWTEVDLERAFIHLKDSKTGARSIPINNAAVDLISAQPELVGNPFVFAAPHKPKAHRVDIRDGWVTIRTAAGLTDLRFHDLRHLYAETAATGGLSLPMIGRLLGHRTPLTTARYAVLADDPARVATEQVADRIVAAMSKEVSE